MSHQLQKRESSEERVQALVVGLARRTVALLQVQETQDPIRVAVVEVVRGAQDDGGHEKSDRAMWNVGHPRLIAAPMPVACRPNGLRFADGPQNHDPDGVRERVRHLVHDFGAGAVNASVTIAWASSRILRNALPRKLSA